MSSFSKAVELPSMGLGLRQLCAFVAGALLLCSARAADYDLLALRMDWGPTACAGGGCARDPFGTFSIYELTPSNINTDDPYQQGEGCPGEAYDATQIPQDVGLELECIFYDANGDSQELWKNLWDTQGRCSGMSIPTYFSAVTSTFNKHNANTALAEAGASLATSPYIDRDEMLAMLKSQWGVQGWVKCDPSTKRLVYVSICLEPNTLQPRDCPWDPSGAGEGGAECAGPVLLSKGVAPSASCAQFYPKTIPGAFPTPLVQSPAPVLSPPPEAASPTLASSPPLSSQESPSPSPDVSPSPSPDVSPSPKSSPPLASPSPKPPSPSPPPPAEVSTAGDEGSSSNIGIIAGAVAGGVLAVVAAIAAFILWRKRAARKQSSNWNDDGMDGADKLSGGDAVVPIGKISGLPPSRLFNPTDTFLPPGSGSGGYAGAGAATAVAASPPSMYHAEPPSPPSPISGPPAANSSGSGLAAAAGGAAAAAAAAAGAALAAGSWGSEQGGSKGEGQRVLPQVAHTAGPLGGDSGMSPRSLLPADYAAFANSAPTASAGTRNPTALASRTTSSVDPLMTYIRSQLKSGASSRAPTSISGLSGVSGPQRPSQNALWNIPFEQIEICKPVGEGSFGRVYLAEWNATSVACKLLLDTKEAQQALELSLPSPLLLKMEEEADIMLSLRHPNCVALMGLCTQPPCLVTEWCERGSLTECLRNARDDPTAAAEMTWQRRLNMALDSARGMLYLHSRTPPIIHRDLKSPNLLVTKDWSVKVTDFNLSKFLSDSTRSSSMAAMNPRWLAPEVMQGERATQAADVFAMGVVMWEMLTWELPWATGNAWQLVSLVTQGGRLPIPPPDQLPGPDKLAPAQLDAYLALMRRCWAQNQYDRPTFTEIAAELRSLLEQVAGPMQ